MNRAEALEVLSEEMERYRKRLLSASGGRLHPHRGGRVYRRVAQLAARSLTVRGPTVTLLFIRPSDLLKNGLVFRSRAPHDGFDRQRINDNCPSIQAQNRAA
jgi:hypothetical protein